MNFQDDDKWEIPESYRSDFGATSQDLEQEEGL